MWFLLQAERERHLQPEVVRFGLDVFNLEEEAPGAAKGFSREGDGLADRGRAFWLNTFYPDIGPVGIAVPV